MNYFDIDDIQNLCKQGKIVWSNHAAQRILQRGISRENVLYAISNGKIIEEYPSNDPQPACLILGYTSDGTAIHIIIGMDDYIHIITAYYPDDRFEIDKTTRRRR